MFKPSDSWKKDEDQSSLQSLADAIKQMQTSISDMSLTIENTLKSNLRMEEETKPTDRQYISLWKDLGGTELCFYPGGSYHPVHFLKKLTRLFDEAGVPQSARVGLAVTCLEGSAADWAGYREGSFESYAQFLEAFEKRYWGMREQRELLRDIKNGKYEGGENKADYFLRLAHLSTYLTEKIDEKELIESLTDHFSDDSDIRRGIISGGLETVEEVEDFLRRMESTKSRPVTVAEERNNAPWFRHGYRRPSRNDRGIDRHIRE